MTRKDGLDPIQWFIDSLESRLFLIDGAIAFAYAKSRATLRGDGQTTVRTLCARISQGESPRASGLLTSSYFSPHLVAHGLTADSILPKAFEIPVDFVANISAGGTFQG